MKKLELKDNLLRADEIEADEEYYLKDSEKIVEICQSQGYQIDKLTAYNAWWNYSEDFCADWLALPSEDQVMRHMFEYCNVIEG